MKTRSLVEVVPLSSLPLKVLARAVQDTEMQLKRSVLVVDDDRKIADTVVKILELNGYDAEAAYSGEEALANARKFHPDILISDVALPDLDGISLADTIERISPKTKIVLICESLPHRDGLLHWPVLKKPFSAGEMLSLMATQDAKPAFHG